MRKSAKPAKSRGVSWRQRLLAAALTPVAALCRRPLIAGGATAFLVAFTYVSANALWNQPGAHPGAFFATRSLDGYVAPEGETVIRFEREDEEHQPTPPDPVVKHVQSVLTDLNLYTGSIDGVEGPRTRSAIENYRRIVGLEPTGDIDEKLLKHLGEPLPEAAMAALPKDAATTATVKPDFAAPAPADKAAAPKSDANIIKIQAGLRAFGNEGIALDGVLGAKTQSAIKEFQSLFGLPVTGKPDAAVHAKMREIGLTD
jgi:peptidoglycan hydrolase-like protein with peptidoglycan-binding domain